MVVAGVNCSKIITIWTTTISAAPAATSFPRPNGLRAERVGGKVAGREWYAYCLASRPRLPLDPTVSQKEFVMFNRHLIWRQPEAKVLVS